MQNENLSKQEELDNFWNNLDIEPVNKFFSELLQLPVSLKKVREKNWKDNIYYSLVDETNIAPKNPITNAAWKTMVVNTFSSWLTKDDESGEIRYYGDINISYEHHGGGSNGANIGYAEFKNGNWKIGAACQRGER